MVGKTTQAGATPAWDSSFPSIGVERYTRLAVRKDLPNRNRGYTTLMPVYFRLVAQIGNLLFRRLAVGSHQTHQALRVANPRHSRLPVGATFRDTKSRCRPGLHRPGCGGSTPPLCRERVASIAAMQRSLKPQSTGQHRGSPPSLEGRRMKSNQHKRVRGFISAFILLPSVRSRSSNYQNATLRTSRLQVRALPGVPFSPR